MDNNENKNFDEYNNASNGVAIASMVMGILSILFIGIPFLTLILGLVALILGIVGLNKSKKLPENKGKGFSIAGIITSSIGTVCNLCYSIFWVLVFTGLILAGAAASGEFGNTLNSYNTYNSYRNVNVTVKKYSQISVYENNVDTILDTTYRV